MSDVTSAGRHGTTCRPDVLGRVDVPVVQGAAGGDRLGQPPVTDHVLHGQVFDHDHVMVTDQARRGAVQKVRAGGGDLSVRTGHRRPRLGPIVRPASLTSHPPLISGQVPLPPGQMPGVSDLLTSRSDLEILYPKIHTHHRTGERHWFGVGDLDGERDVPTSAWLTRHRHRCRLKGRGIDERQNEWKDGYARFIVETAPATPGGPFPSRASSRP